MFAAADSIVLGDNKALPSSAVGVEGPEGLLANRGLFRCGDLLVGKVLLLCTPDVGGVTKPGVIGLGIAPEWRERLEEVETLRRTPPYLRKLSAPALDDVEAERLIPELFRPGVVGVLTCGVLGPLSICLTVPSSTAVPSIPIKKWS
jgi:hypothetical protein